MLDWGYVAKDVPSAEFSVVDVFFSGVPHSRQNLAASIFCVPHLLQYIFHSPFIRVFLISNILEYKSAVIIPDFKETSYVKSSFPAGISIHPFNKPDSARRKTLPSPTSKSNFFHFLKNRPDVRLRST